MRKTILGAAVLPLLALMATSCSDERVETKDDFGRELTFKATTGKQTISRASEIDYNGLKSKELTVYAYNARNNSPFGTFTIEYVDNKWTYGNPVFHPTTFELNHYSVYPTDNVTFGTNHGSFDYEVPNDPADQEDLVAAYAYSTSVAPVAQLGYQHILSQVNFAVKGKKGLMVMVGNISLSGVKNKGTFDFLNWDVDDSSTGFYTYSHDNNNTLTTTGGEEDDEKVYYLGNWSGDNSNSNALMLMPQTLEDGILIIEFKFIDRDINPSTIPYTTALIPLKVLNTTEWKMGKRHLYVLSFDPAYLGYEASLPEWEDGDSSTVDPQDYALAPPH